MELYLYAKCDAELRRLRPQHRLTWSHEYQLLRVRGMLVGTGLREHGTWENGVSDGGKKYEEGQYRSLPMVMTCPSGSS